MKKEKKDKRKSRLAHLSNGAEGQVNETDTTITYDETLQNKPYKQQTDHEQIPTA
jgi:hypothetical protein